MAENDIELSDETKGAEESATNDEVEEFAGKIMPRTVSCAGAENVPGVLKLVALTPPPVPKTA